MSAIKILSNSEAIGTTASGVDNATFVCVYISTAGSVELTENDGTTKLGDVYLSIGTHFIAKDSSQKLKKSGTGGAEGFMTKIAHHY